MSSSNKTSRPSIINNIGTIKGNQFLQRAVWRLTYQDPLQALFNLVRFKSIKESMKTMVLIREHQEHYVMKVFLSQWQKRTAQLKSKQSKISSLLRYLVVKKSDKVRQQERNKLISAFYTWKNKVQ